MERCSFWREGTWTGWVAKYMLKYVTEKSSKNRNAYCNLIISFFFNKLKVHFQYNECYFMKCYNVFLNFLLGNKWTSIRQKTYYGKEYIFYARSLWQHHLYVIKFTYNFKLWNGTAKMKRINLIFFFLNLQIMFQQMHYICLIKHVIFFFYSCNPTMNDKHKTSFIPNTTFRAPSKQFNVT